MTDEYDAVMDGLRGILINASYIYDRHAAQRAIDYIKSLLTEISEKDNKLNIFMNELSKVHHNRELLPHHRSIEFPTSRGTTHGQLMQMQHEAETMHDNPPPDQPMG